MEAAALSLTESFGADHFGRCALGDQRLTKRLVHTANQIMQHPGGTLPQKLTRNADLIGFYRLANHPKVTHAKLIAAHAGRTRELIEQSTSSIILMIHDTTEIDYSGLDVEGLGQLGNGGCRGFLCHNSLAYDYDAHEVLGLSGQLIHKRRKVPKKESPKAKREHPQRESRLWKKGWQAVGPIPGKQLVNVSDCGSDLLEYTEAVHLGGDYYVVRSKSNRNIDLTDGDTTTRAKLHDYAKTLPDLGGRTVEVSTNKGHRGRTAHVRIAAGPVSIRPPHFARGEHSQNNLPAWVIHVREIGTPPPGETPLQWILLTNVPAPDLAAAAERVDWYACRPVIEEFHKAGKTGCGVELTQFTTARALQVSIAILSVVATQLLRLRDLGRRADATTRPATDVIDQDYVIALSAWRFREPRPNLSIAEFCLALAKLGGHLNRTHDGPPGWLTLWRGWTQLQPLVQGLHLARLCRSV